MSPKEQSLQAVYIISVTKVGNFGFNPMHVWMITTGSFRKK